MRNLLKSVTKCFLASLMIAAFFMNVQTVAAQEYATDEYATDEFETDEVLREYMEKKAAGAEVYLLTDDEGNLLGYYEPAVKGEDNSVMPRYKANVNWTLEARSYGRGDNVYTLGGGSKIEVNIAQDTEGASCIELYNTKTDEYTVLQTTETTNGWNGTIILKSIFPSGTYSFSIHNKSSKTITYTGYYIV